MNTVMTTNQFTRCIMERTMDERLKTVWYLIALLCLSLLASACVPGTPAGSGGLSNPVATAAQLTTLPTQTPAPLEASTPSVMLNMNELAQAAATLNLPAMQPDAGGPGAVAMPQRTMLWLYGYPISGHVREPQIFLFTVKDLAMNDTAQQAAQDLQALLQSPQEAKTLPFLPPTTSVQQMHAQVKTLDFKNGKGVRYLTQYSNGMSPINNQWIFYTFQGLTIDGQYYIAAVLPVYLNGLPSYPTDTSNLPLEFTSDFATYIQNTTNQLNLQSDSDYAPDLGKLDALVQSIEVKE